jgi:hypothetical protein
MAFLTLLQHKVLKPIPTFVVHYIFMVLLKFNLSVTYKVWSSAVIDSPISCTSSYQNGKLKKMDKLG